MPRVHQKSNGEGEVEGVSATSTPNQGQSARKRHVCPTCERCFTTSGHLARHSRVHTGEKNHKCPFPGCDTRCSRQDNLQQHYRIHLSPGSRRTSSRSSPSASRRGRRGTTNNNISTPSQQQEHGIAPEQPPLSPPPLVPATIPPSLSPSPLEPARAYSPPPDSPPPLAHATIPGSYQHVPQGASPVSSATSSPDASSFPLSDSSLSISPPPPVSTHSATAVHPNSYDFRAGPIYQDPGNDAVYPYRPSDSPTSESYSQATSEGYTNNHYSLPRIETLTANKDDLSVPPPVTVPSTSLTGGNSRHSISHISHSHSQSAYPRQMSTSMNSRPNTGPPSPASSHSTSHSVVSHSGPPTPNGYPSYDADSSQSSPYDQTSPPLSSHSGGSIIAPSLSRYSPPPVLAPIHGFSSHNTMEVMARPARASDQYERRPSSRSDYSERYAHYETRYVPDEPRYGRPVYGLTHHERQELSPVQAYMPHQPSSMANYHDMYTPVGSVSLHHGAWKSEHLTSRGMKSINALVQ
ncbi:hypothetical protein J3R30DRAFT_3560865 [Lentinula aciculospora]|uniref:C2H2-type domain-containing protein n=1 Tax=Lentinula aciculospora TaxID=153920 RepID=A0A9W9DGF6_9AGAR|nr:hypothetical protein J3R30DRAFT_3560865 [Lentinula aciculospora]